MGTFFFKVARKLEQPLSNPESRMVRPGRIYTVTTTPDDDTEAVVERSRPRPRPGTENPAVRVWDPMTQQWLPPSMVPQRRSYSLGGAIITVTSVQPSMPPVRLQSRPGGTSTVITDGDVNAMRQPSETRYLDPYGPQATEAYSTGTNRDGPTEQPSAATSSEQPASSSTSTAMTRPAPATRPAAPQAPAEYGTRVPGKPGFVYPPGVEQETKNMLDVRGLSAGQKVRDPRDGKVFLVP